MNLKPMHASRNTSRVKREPLRTFVEIAQELGLSVSELRGHVAQTKLEAPKPEFVKRNTRQASWYRPSIFRQWWEAHCKLQEKSL
jgi:hypothetical protein